MYGTLIEIENRPDVIFENGTLYGGIHCGECFQILLDKWYAVRLELRDDWVLIYKDQVFPISYGCKVFVE